jgi:hypothetical protein
MTSSSALALLGACWLAACSFPEYEFVTEPKADPLASVCTDGLPSPAETGIDCGGGCPPCRMGETCAEHADCESLACRAQTCQVPTCGDTVKNGSESDADCGGQCDGCPPGRDCRADEDCTEGVCTHQICQFPRCDDTVQNGDESGVDCGGSCTPCEIGEGCRENAHCTSNHCSDEVCVAAECTDGVQNELETDVDCGGPQCGPCGAGKVCEIDAHCVSLICDDDDRCTAHACDDQVLNGDESALDCGGEECDGCSNLEPCREGADCASGACQSGLCVPAAPTGAPLSRTGWTATASNSWDDDVPAQVLDSEGGRWTSGTSQVSGMSFEIDMLELRAFFSIVMLCQEAPEDFPQSFDVYLSTDGVYPETPNTHAFGNQTSLVGFDTVQVARYIKIVVTQEKSKWWSIDEINVLE